jgi:lipase
VEDGRSAGRGAAGVRARGEGPDPVLALHGITAQHRSFNAVARHLESSGCIVGLDLRGRDDSGKPPEGSYGLEAHARDVVRTLDHLGVERGVICGHSLGAFVALKTAFLYPERVAALVLLDGGWPRPEEEPDEAEAAALREGLDRAFACLEMVFETPEGYLNFWFPDQNLTYDDLPPDLADYYRCYDLTKVEGGYRPKALSNAAREDAGSIPSGSPTLGEMRGVACPVALARAAENFLPGSAPLISDDPRDAMAGTLDLREEIFLDGATHYTILFSEHARKWVHLLRRGGRWKG